MRAWLQIIRPPNLFTVPGDPLAGFFLTLAVAGPRGMGLRHAAFAAAAALCLYTGGLIGNDVADLREDARDRPDRPLPSGRISRTAAFAASAVCAVAGILLAGGAGFGALAMACLTQAAIMLYNGWLKRLAVPGALAMGACRACSFLIGVCAANPRAITHPAIVYAAAGLLVCIAGVTWIADRETVEARIGPRRWLPCLALLAVLLIFVCGGRPAWPFPLLAAGAVAWAGYQGWRLRGVPPRPVLGSAIGGLIRGLLLIQAAWCAFGGGAGFVVAAIILALWPASIAAGRRFYAT